MAGSSKNMDEFNPFIAELLEANGYGTVYEACKATGLDNAQLHRVANKNYSNRTLLFHMKAARAFGVSLEDWLAGLFPNEYSELEN